MAWRQHQLLPACSCVLACCHHAPSTFSSSTCHPELPTTCCFVLSPNPKSSIPCLPSQDPAQPCHYLLCLYNPSIASFTLSPSSLTLFCTSWVSHILFACILIPHPEQTNSAEQVNVFPHHQVKSCSQPLNHPQAAASTLLQRGAAENIPQPTDHHNPEVSDNVPSSALLLSCA